MKALVFTPPALFRLAQFSISSEWFESYGLPHDAVGLKRVVVGGVIYILEDSIDTDSGPVIVINLEENAGVFSDATTKSNVLERIITVARSVYTDCVTIPTGWRRHKEENLLSIQAPSREKKWRSRLHFEINPNDSGDLFAFSRTDDIVNFRGLERYEDIYHSAKLSFAEAVLSPPGIIPSDSLAGIVLTQRLPQGFLQGATLDQWYESKLTKEQRVFVDKKHDGPVRLRGAAGTGKTISLVIKFLRDAQLAEKAAGEMKFGFITHSSASVDLVTAIAESLDADGLLYRAGGKAKLEVRTLYELADKHLNFTLDELMPLSIDGREGRHLQFELIEAALKEMHSGTICRLRFSDITPSIMERWSASVVGDDDGFVFEIMNEFASVLDAEGIRAGQDKAERYARNDSARPKWLMHLPLEMDRRFVLEVHQRYRKMLEDMDTLSVDQMVADFNHFLDSNRWDRIRRREGFDALFVDELHLFTSIERQILHKLMRQNVEDDGRPKRPPIFMAYDLKQSPRDAFSYYLSGDKKLFSASSGLQGSELVELERVFRYTPQIAEFLADLDATFPAVDIPGEWDAYSGKAELEDGKKPELTVFQDEKTLFSTVFKAAEKVARSVDGGGRRVAVLCASEEQFDIYLKAASGQFAGRHLPITDRGPSSELRHAGKRFIFSMPEYVAGLQFHTVFLIHVDAKEAPPGSSDGVRRRFISNIYLGSSRAEQSLHLSACLMRGGKSHILDMALARKSLSEIFPPASNKRLKEPLKKK